MSTVPAPIDRAARIQELAQRLLETEAELRRIGAGEIDAILDPETAQPLLLREAQEAVRRAESRWRELIAGLPIIAAELEPDGTTCFVNGAVTHILGFFPRELVGAGWWERLGVQPGGGPLALLGRRQLSGVEQAVRTRAGSERVIIWSSRHIEQDGRVSSVLLFGLDVTAQRQASETESALIREQVARAEAEAAERRSAMLAEASRLLSSALRYEATLTSIAHLAVSGLAEYCIVDLVEPDGTMRRIDVAHPDLHHADPLRELLAAASPADCPLRVIRRVIGSGKAEYVPSVTAERAALLADADIAPELVGRSFACAPLSTRGHTLGAFTIISARDFREYGVADFELFAELARRAALAVDNARLYEAALSASQAKSDFLAVMSHELRTPLNAILGYTDLMLLGVPEPVPGATAGHVERVQLAARHLLQMIEEILTLSRVEAGEEVIDVERFELCTSLRETATLVEPLAHAKTLELRCETPDGEVFVSTDARKLRQILLNLLGNAVKFTSSGEIMLHARVLGSDVVIVVQDTGDGIAAENMERIFDPFWQVEQQKARRREGAGLGLHVARRLARLMGGDLTVSSEVGDGTRFVLRLPGVAEAG